jgi:quercetin dioxygenase-like cupin family protein
MRNVLCAEGNNQQARADGLELTVTAMLESRLMKQRFVVPAILLAAFIAAAQAPSEVEISAEPHHHLAIENEYIRAYKVEVAPNEATLMHRHGHDYVFVTLGDSDVSNEVEGWQPIELKIQDGETRFAPGNFAHIARNLAKTPFRNITVELLQDEKARQSPPAPWDEERGLDVLNAGTKHILFVKDGVRVSEFELQPGGVVPSHHHAGPHLVVAVSDLDVRNNVEGQAPMLGKLKAGDIKWLPGGYTHTLTNMGKKSAHFVTLEFH